MNLRAWEIDYACVAEDFERSRDVDALRADLARIGIEPHELDRHVAALVSPPPLPVQVQHQEFRS